VVHQMLEPMKHANEMQVRRTAGRLSWAPDAISVFVRFVVAACLKRCRTRAPRPRMRMGS
jgi:hypothetical protein